MTKREAFNGKPQTGNPHVRFDEEEVAPATPRRGFLLYKKRLMMFGAAVAFAVMSAATFADGIRWEHAKNITGDADVRTDGVLRYAYANKAATVNGVRKHYTTSSSCGRTTSEKIPATAATSRLMMWKRSACARPAALVSTSRVHLPQIAIRRALHLHGDGGDEDDINAVGAS